MDNINDNYDIKKKFLLEKIEIYNRALAGLEDNNKFIEFCNAIKLLQLEIIKLQDDTIAELKALL